MRKMLHLFFLAAIGVFLWKNTSLPSYLGTLWSQSSRQVQNQIPTRFELSRVRNEIAGLDGDIQSMIRPIAENMAGVAKLRKEIQTVQANLERQKSALLGLTRELETNPAYVLVQGESVSVGKARERLQREFESFQRLETHQKSLQQLLDAKEQSLRATQDQLEKVLGKKREFEIRLAQLEADEETLQIAKIGSSLTIDDTRATQIEAALSSVEHRHHVLRAEIDLRTGSLAQELEKPGAKHHKPIEVQAIRQYLEGSSPAE